MLPPKLTQLTQDAFLDAPSWLQRVFAPLNLFMSQTWNCLQNLTIGQNVTGQIIDVTFKTGGNYTLGEFPKVSVKWPYRKSVQVCTVAQVIEDGNSTAIFFTAPFATWRQVGNTVAINYISGLQDNKSYAVTLLVL